MREMADWSDPCWPFICVCKILYQAEGKIMAKKKVKRKAPRGFELDPKLNGHWRKKRGKLVAPKKPLKKKAKRVSAREQLPDLVKGKWVIENSGCFLIEDPITADVAFVNSVGGGFDHFLSEKDAVAHLESIKKIHKSNLTVQTAVVGKLSHWFANHHTSDNSGAISVSILPIGEAVSLKELLRAKREYWVNCIKGAQRSVNDVIASYRSDSKDAAKYLRDAKAGLNNFDKWAKQYG